MPFIQSTKVLSLTGYCVTFFIKPRKPCDDIDIIITSLSVTARFKSHVKSMDLSKVTYSFLPVFFNTSYEYSPSGPQLITLLFNTVA